MITAWIALAGSILTEVTATMSLRMASAKGARWIWWIPVVVGYTLAFSLLAVTLAHGMPLGVAYGIWSAVGVALTAALSKVVFGEPMTGVMALGIALIIGGVLLIEVGAAH